MSTPPNKLDQRAEEVYYTQELLTEVFAAPIARAMQESAEAYILTGKFKNLVPSIQTSMQALWDRALYAGIADAEFEIDNPTRESKISLSSNLSDIIEFAKDPQIARLDGLIKEQTKYLQEAQGLFNAREVLEIQRNIDILKARRDEVKNPKNPTIARKVAEKIRLEKELDTAKRAGNFDKVAQIRAQLYPSGQATSAKPPGPVSEERPEVRQGKKRVITTKDQIAREVASGRRSVNNVLNPRPNTLGGEIRNLLSFDPNADMERDPWSLLFIPEARAVQANAAKRLRTTNTLQMYATLNERYPSIGQNSIFAQDYLRFRQNTVATSLEDQYQDQIKNTVAGYVAQDKAAGKEGLTLKRIQKSYQSDKKNRYTPFVENLKSKIEYTEESPTQYLNRLREELKAATPKERTPAQLALEERFNKLTKIEATLNDRLESAILRDKTPQEQKQLLQSEAFKRLRRNLNEAQVRLGDVEKQLQDQDMPKEAIDLRKRINKIEIDLEAGRDVRTKRNYKSIRLSKEEKEQLIRLGNYDDKSVYAGKLADNIRGQKEFTYRQINGYVKDLKREGGRFDESLYQIAARTAATEVAAAYSIGRLQTYIERGVNYVQWVATMDARTSVFCQSLHRKIFAVRDLIPAAMAKQTFPRTRKPEWDPENQNIKSAMGINTWVPPAHPYCRSFLSPIYTDEARVGDKYPPGGFPPDANLNKYLLADLIEREKQFLGMKPKQKELWLEEIVQSQNKMRESKTAKILRSMGNLQEMFNSGLSYLTRRLKQDKVANFTVDEIKRNDSQLTAALIGGAAVLGTGAMMYFFMKSNLAQTLQEYIKTSVGSLVVGSLGPEAIKKLLANLVKTSKEIDKMPDSIKDLMASEIDLNDVSLGEKINSINSLGEVAYEMASLGNFKDIENLISSGQVGGLTNQAPKAIATRAAYNAALQKRAELTSRVNDIMAAAIRNKGGSIQPSDIIRISEWPNNYAIVVRGKGNTFVSKKIFDEMMENPVVRSEIDRLREEIDKFDVASRGIEEYDNGDIISDSVKTADRLEYLRLRGNLRALSERVLNRDVIKPNVSLPENLPEVNSILNQAIEVEADYSRALDALYDEFKSVLPSQNLLRGFIPETINSIEELKAVQKLVKNSLAEVRRDFLTKGKSYTPSTAARKRNMDIDLNETLLNLENLERRLESNGLQYNASVSELNTNYQNRINTDLSSIIDLDARINNRIKELSD